MISVGVIACLYGQPELLNNCLSPWFELKKELNIKIGAVHGLFKENYELGVKDNDKETLFKLLSAYEKGLIDYLFAQSLDEPIKYRTEAELRDKGLKFCLNENVDYVFLLDIDEKYSKDEIRALVNYIQLPDNKFYDWFRINFKNYVFSGKEWIDGFKPPRIFKVKTGNNNCCILDSFFWDNDVRYKIGNRLVSYETLPSKEISKRIAHIKHLTWLNNEKSHLKVLYHEKHFGPPKGFGCSYKWDEEKKTLAFNLDYYKKTGQSLPEIHVDTDNV